LIYLSVTSVSSLAKKTWVLVEGPKYIYPYYYLFKLIILSSVNFTSNSRKWEREGVSYHYFWYEVLQIFNLRGCSLNSFFFFLSFFFLPKSSFFYVIYTKYGPKKKKTIWQDFFLNTFEFHWNQEKYKILVFFFSLFPMVLLIRFHFFCHYLMF
jgi:hypothetical protein